MTKMQPPHSFECGQYVVAVGVSTQGFLATNVCNIIHACQHTILGGLLCQKSFSTVYLKIIGRKDKQIPVVLYFQGCKMLSKYYNLPN